MGKYVMALDQGTTSSRCILFDKAGNILSMAQKEFEHIYPKTGWVEHDPMEIWSSQMAVATEAMAKIKAEAKDIAALGITNQRETTICWDKNTGTPIYNAICWQCHRTADMVEELKKDGFDEVIRQKTGLIPDAYFSGTKITWILDNVEGAREKAEAGDLLFGTVDTWLIWNLTKGRIFVTDYTNASRTMLFNIHDKCWDEELLQKLRIPRSMLAEVKPSSCIYGMTEEGLLGGSIQIAGAAIQWLRDEMRMLRNSAQSEEYAKAVEDTNGVYVVPAFTGLGAPYWNQYCRGMVVGITRGCSKEHFVRATLESLAYQTHSVLRAMEQDTGVSIQKLRVDGGASANDFLMQFQADILKGEVLRPSCIETTALGAAYLAGLAVGYWRNKEEIRENWQLSRTFSPSMEENHRIKCLKGWEKAVKCALMWQED